MFDLPSLAAVRQARGSLRAAGLKAASTLALAILVLVVYLKTGRYGFINFDDGIYVANNDHVKGGLSVANLVWACTSVDRGTGYWAPVTWLSHMADVELFGMDPGYHHLTNVAIHLAATLVLLLLLTRVTAAFWQSLFVAALFALHPLRVESVAWIAERKDVLGAFFWCLTLLLYSAYLSRRKTSRYLFTLASFALGLMSKPMLVTLPLVMLLMDFWPLRRPGFATPPGVVARPGAFRALLLEKVPFFALSLVSGAIAIYAQKTAGALIAVGRVPLSLRVENALVSYLKYLGMTLWPRDLALLYPFPPSVPLWQVIGSALLLLLVSLAVLVFRQRCPYLVLGWFWYLVTLLPVIGLVQVGTQALADRFSYIPSIGLYLALAWGAADLCSAAPRYGRVLASLAVVLVLVCSALTWRQLDYWQDSLTLFRHTLQVTSGNHIMHNDLGVVLEADGALDQAIGEYREATRLQPDYPEAHYNLGVALYKKGDLDEALKSYRRALAIDPANAQAHHNLGLVLAAKGDLDAAVGEYRAALDIKPDFALVHNKLGLIYARQGYPEQAVSEFARALQIEPGYRDARENLEFMLARRGTGPE
jgi:tetratricopeptide (TPR) repeat protein